MGVVKNQEYAYKIKLSVSGLGIVQVIVVG